MTRSRMRAAVWALLGVLVLPGAAQGQARRGAIVGIVRTVGDSGAPLPGADVLLGKRKATTDPRGSFRIDSLSPGNYVITIRHIGYRTIRDQVEVGSEPVTIEYFMTPAPYTLPEVVVSTRRTGIFGVVLGLGERPIAGALVEALGHNGGFTRTDSLGRFAFLAPRQGGYLVRVTADGYVERRATLELEAGEGGDLRMDLVPGRSRRAGRRQEAALFELRQSLATGFRRERLMGTELARYGSMSVCEVPRIRVVAGDPARAVLNGEIDLSRGQVCSWQMDEIALIQFVAGRTRYTRSGPVKSEGYVIVWEKW